MHIYNYVKLWTVAYIFILCQSCSQWLPNFILLSVEHFVTAVLRVVFWNLWTSVLWIPWRCHLGAETCSNCICYIRFLVILCAFDGYCNCKNDAGIVECQRLKPFSEESFIRSGCDHKECGVLLCAIHQWCGTVYVDKWSEIILCWKICALWLWSSDTQRIFVYFFLKNIALCMWEMDIGDLGNRACALAYCTVLKMSYVFIGLCFI